MSRLVAVFLFTLLSLTFSSTLLHGEVAVRDGQRVASSSQSPNFVRELTDDNFEHDTQASTGSTTGDWFVVFQAPWCGHCKSIKQSWSDLATWVRDEQFPVSIASLDATQHVRTAKRLDIRGFPTIKFISKGEIYDYSGPRTLQSFQQYLENREWLLPGVTKRPVPPEVSTMEWLKDYLRETMNDVSTLMWRKPGGAAILVSLGVLVGILLSMLIFIVFIEPKPIIHPVTIGTPTLPIRNNSQQTSTSSTSSSIPQTNVANKKAE